VRTFDECFDVDPWFQLEAGTSGAMLTTYMEPQRKRQRKRLRFEYASSETIAAEKLAAEVCSSYNPPVYLLLCPSYDPSSYVPPMSLLCPPLYVPPPVSLLCPSSCIPPMSLLLRPSS